MVLDLPSRVTFSTSSASASGSSSLAAFGRGAWEDRAMRTLRVSLLAPPVQATVIGVLVMLLAVFTWITPPHAEVLHNVLHHLNILPFMLAGLIFGWRGALQALLLAT